MAKEFVDIEDIFNKNENEDATSQIEQDEVPEDEYVSLDQWKRLGMSIKQLQEDAKTNIKTLTYNGSTKEPDEDGNVILSEGEGDILRVTILKGSAQAFSIDKPFTIGFQVDNQIDSQYDASWVAKVYVKKNRDSGSTVEELVASITPSAASDSETIFSTPNLANYLTKVAGIIDLVRIDVSRLDNSKNISRSISVSNVTVSLLWSNRDIAEVNPETVGFVTNYVGETPKIHINIANIANSPTHTFYDENFEITNGISAGGFIAFTLPTLSAAVYRITAKLSINEEAAFSEEISSEIIIASSTGYYIAVEPVVGYKQYDTADIKFAVYAKGALTANITKVIIEEGGIEGSVIPDIVPTVSDGNKTASWAYQIPTVENHLVIRIYADDDVEHNTILASRAISFNVLKSEVDWKTPEGEELFLTAVGKTNSGLANDWSFGKYNTTFIGVSFKDGDSGWYNTGTKNFLRLQGGAQAIVNIYPYYRAKDTSYNPDRGVLNTGSTVKFRIATSNVADILKPVVSCWDDSGTGLGFKIFPDSIYAKLGDTELVSPVTESQMLASHNERRFPTITPIEIGFTIQPYMVGTRETNHQVTMYINGQFAGCRRISNSTLTMSRAIPISFGSNACTLDIYNVRVYNRCLSSLEMLWCHTMDLDNNSDMVAKFNNNQCYQMTSSTTAKITLPTAIAYAKKKSAEGVDTVIITTNDRRLGVTDTKSFDSTSLKEMRYYFFKNGEVDLERSVRYVGRWIRYYDSKIAKAWVTTSSLQILVQGTSTALEYIKNLLAKAVKGTDYYKDADAGDTTESTYIYEDGDKYIDNGNTQNLPHYGVYKYVINPDTGDFYEDNAHRKLIKKLDLHIEQFQGGEAQDNECNTITIKENFNESTGINNLAMAKWINDAKIVLATKYPDILTPPQKKDSKVRQTINGIPGIMFHNEYGDYEFAGKVDLITDKKNETIFGFGILKDGQGKDVDFSVEARDNTSEVCCFRTADLTKAGVYLEDGKTKAGDHLEYRHPDTDSFYGDGILGPNTAMQNMYDFVLSCDPERLQKKYTNGIEGSTNDGSGQYMLTLNGSPVGKDNEPFYDTVENRKIKFKEELGNYTIKSSFVFNAFNVFVLLFCDQRAKNTFWTHFFGDTVIGTDGVIRDVIRILEYDLDSVNQDDNQSHKRFDFVRLASDGIGIYDDGVAEAGSVHAGKNCLLFNLLDECFIDGDENGCDYATFFSILSSATGKKTDGYPMLSPEGIMRYFDKYQGSAFNDIIYNNDSEYKYQEKASDDFKAHGSALEYKRWWIEGRLYFIGGMFWEGADSGTYYTDYEMTFWPGYKPNLDETNQALYSDKLEFTSKYRNYYACAGNGLGRDHSQMCEAWTDDNYPESKKKVSINLGTTGDSLQSTAKVYGLKHARSLDLSRVYPQQIVSWGNQRGGTFEDVDIEILKFGDHTISGYKNNQLSSLQYSASREWKFGCCKYLDITGLTKLSSLDLQVFPVVEELYAEGCDALEQLTMPLSVSLKIARLPKNLNKIEFVNKPNLVNVYLEGYSHIEEVLCDNVNANCASTMIDLLVTLYM